MTTNVKALFLQPTASEQRFTLDDIAWEQYETLRATLDSVPGLRLTYFQGCLEFFMPSPEHEQLKSILGRLIELFSLETHTRLYACGSTTYRKQATARGLEADESYCVDHLKDFPDLAIEVTLTSGGINKLEVYRGLEIPEVWFWDGETLRLFSLQNGEYQAVSQSQILPNLDIKLLVRCALMPDQFDAAVEFRRVLQERKR
jgi:Uma2 family endonuclease